jgi:hypothetical protein
MQAAVYPRAGHGMVVLRTVYCAGCSHPLMDAAPGILVRLRCSNRRCRAWNIVEVNEAGLIRARVET